MARVGYARVSTAGQSLDVQLARLAGCDRVFREKRSGAAGLQPELARCLEYVREGDSLEVTRLDRLARSTLHLCQIAAELARKGVDLRVLDQQIDTGSSTGRLLFNVLAAIAQFETEIRAERQREGIERARQRGTKFGGPKKLQPAQAAELVRRHNQGSSINALAFEFRVARRTVYRYLDGTYPRDSPTAS